MGRNHHQLKRPEPARALANSRRGAWPAPSPAGRQDDASGGAGAQRSRRRSADPQKSGRNAYGLAPRMGQQWCHRTRRHQQWTTRHPIRFQECADRRPLLQQSSSDLSVSRSPSGSPNAPSKVPRVHRNRSPGCHGPRCRFPQLRPPTHPLIVQRSRTADDSLMVTAWRHGLRAPRPAATRHHPSSALIGPSSPQLSPIPRARSQQGSGFSMGQIRFTTPQDPAAERPAPR